MRTWPSVCKQGEASWDKSLSLTQSMLDTALSRRSSEYNGVRHRTDLSVWRRSSGIYCRCVEVFFPSTFSDTNCFAVSGARCHGFTKVFLKQKETLLGVWNTTVVCSSFLMSVITQRRPVSQFDITDYWPGSVGDHYLSHTNQTTPFFSLNEPSLGFWLSPLFTLKVCPPAGG